MLPLPVAVAIDLFTVSFPAFDERVELVDGREFKTLDTNFTLIGSVQPMSDKQLKFLPQGVEADSGLVIRTRQVLNYLNETPQLQTFINAYGRVWRVIAQKDWGLYGGYNKYLATVYVERL